MTRFALPFDRQCHLVGLPQPVAEYPFASEIKRKWRVDWCFIDQKVAVEVEGGAFVGGRHTRGAGFLKDLDKYNTLACFGYRLIRVTPRQIENGQALSWVASALQSSKEITP